MAKKKPAGEGEPKRYGTLIRVSDAFAEALHRAASFEGLSIADYATAHLLPAVEERYREAVLREAERLKGERPRGKGPKP